MKKLSSEELAEAWKAGKMRLQTAARKHFKLIGLWPVHEKIMFSLELILGFANLGMTDTPVLVAENEEMTVGEVVQRFQLADFLG